MNVTTSQCSVYITVSSSNVAYSSWIKGFVTMCFLQFKALNTSTYPDCYHMIGWLWACHILTLRSVHLSGVLLCVIRLHTAVCTVSDIFKYIYYNIFAHSTEQILLELKNLPWYVVASFSPPAYKNIYHTLGSSEEYFCTTGGVVFLWDRCLLPIHEDCLQMQEHKAGENKV